METGDRTGLMNRMMGRNGMNYGRRASIAGALAAAMLLTGCGVFKGGGNKGPKTAVLGERIPVLTQESSAGTDASIASTPVTLPPAEVNANWTQPGGNAQKAMGNLALGATLREALRGAGFTVPISEGPIVPVILGEVDPAIALSAALLEAGYLVPAIRPPTVPRGTARLRISLSAAHSQADVDGLVDAMAGLKDGK